MDLRKAFDLTPAAPKKLAIVGSDPAGRDKAPYDDPSFDIWVFNEAGNHKWCKRWTTVFQMHHPNIYKGHNTKDPKHWEWLQRKHGKPIYMQDADPEIPDSVKFPMEEACQLAGAEMFGSTFSYMAAMAVVLDYEYIEIHGMGLSSSEYDYQKFSYVFWLGFLRGKLGAENVRNVITYLGREIGASPRYGYEGNFSFGSDYFANRARVHLAEFESAEKNLQNMKKALDKALDRNEFDEVQRLTLQYQAAAMKAGEHSGALSEAERYQKFGSRYADRGGFENAGARAQQDGEAKKPLIWHYGGMAEYAWNVWKQNKQDAARKQLSGFITQMGKSAYETGAMLGIFRENVEYINKYDLAAHAGGEVLLRNDA